MKFKLKKEVILDNLQKVLGPTTTKQNFPILNSVLVSTEKNKIKFTATDLDVTIISFQEAEIEEQGILAIPMKRFFSIIKELPSGDIMLETAKNNLLISCEKVEFKINTLSAEEFPKIEEPKENALIKLNPGDLEEMIRMTSFSVGYEDVNYVLNGILFEIEKDTIRLVSTDGKRLAFVERKLPVSQTEVTKKVQFILPIKAVSELHKLIKERNDDLYLFAEENKVGFDFKDTQFVARPIEGEFPNYSQYIPKPGKDKLTINRKDFLLALRRAALLATPDYQGVKVDIKKEKAIISKSTPQLGEVKEEILAQFSGAPTSVGFNPAYLLDVLKNVEEEEATFEFFGADKPVVLRKENYVYLVLPMKI
ncbi:MAG: DNA polymerase III subunit beta [Candidatus Omnitrophica bacterium]|nr:DNA polymerase III subunit beta [Candidatus Omnitrophota bacterium]